MSNHRPGIRLQRDGETATLVIDHPARHNAISEAMWQGIADAVDTVHADAAIRVLVVTGAGGQAFSAGADISEFTSLASDPARLRTNNRIVQEAQEKLEALDRPTIALVRGLCFGGGCGLALACDFRFATPESVFAITPARLGLAYSWRDTRRLLALDWGLINHIVPAADITGAVQHYAGELMACSQYSIRHIKQAIAGLEGYGAADAEAIRQRFDDAFTLPDCQEGVQAFLEKRPPRFPWTG